MVEVALVAFVRARIAQDQWLARAVTGKHHDWRAFPMKDVAGCSVYDDQWLLATIAWYDHNKPMSNRPEATGPAYINSDRLAEHIARWDPARVLAECEAKTRIVNRYEFAVRQAEVIAGMGDDAEAWAGIAEALELCVGAMAEVYKDHADYDPTWFAI